MEENILISKKEFDRLSKKKNYSVKYYEGKKAEELEKIYQEFKTLFPTLTVPMYSFKKGFSIDKYKKDLVKLVIGDLSVFDYIVNMYKEKNLNTA